MKNSHIDEMIYDRFIAPTERKRNSFIGIEIELPIVDLSGAAVNEEKVVEVARDFKEHFFFKTVSIDDNGNANSISDPVTGDNLSFDCSYSNLELSFGKSNDLNKVYSQFVKYYKFLQNKLAGYHYMLTGMGINPHYNINHNLPIPNERYRMLYHYLHTYHRYENTLNMKFHNRPDFGTFTSASQVQLDVCYGDLIETLNVFNMLEPYKALLFANSYLPEYPEYLCARNMLWEHSMQGYNPHNVGMFEKPLSSVEELVDYISSESLYCTMREGKYIDFAPTAVKDYFGLEKMSGEYWGGRDYDSAEFVPAYSDIQYLRTFKFEDLTFRGTIEYRSSCTQPIKDVMTVAAFHTGLSGRLGELRELIESDRTIYSHGYTAMQLQDMLSKRDIPDFIDKKGLSSQLLRILDIAYQGLKERHKNEERFLLPLFERVERLTNPAREMIAGNEKGKPMRDYILQYAAI